MSDVNQKAFEVIVKHLREQKAKAVSVDGECRYRFENEEGVTLMCALGCLIDDSMYREDFEGLEAHELFARHDRSVLGEYSDCDLEFLQDMQHLHDDMQESAWNNGFKEIAKKWELKVPRRSRKGK